MAIAKTVEAFLQQNRIAYSVVCHSPTSSIKETAAVTTVPPEKIAKAVMLHDGGRYVMAVLPGDRHVQTHKLSRKLGCKLELASETEIAPVFKDCERGAIPPLGPAYGIETVVDESLVGQKEICFISGDHQELVCMNGGEFLRLLLKARHGHFSH